MGVIENMSLPFEHWLDDAEILAAPPASPEAYPMRMSNRTDRAASTRDRFLVLQLSRVHFTPAHGPHARRR